MFDHFKNIIDTPDENTQNEQYPQSNIDMQNSEINPELDMIISEEEIKKAVFMQNNGRSPGIDEIPCEIIKASYEIIAPFLFAL